MATLEVRGFAREDYTFPWEFMGREFMEGEKVAKIFVCALLGKYFRWQYHTAGLPDITIDGVEVHKFVLIKKDHLSGEGVYSYNYDTNQHFNVRITLKAKQGTVLIETQQIPPHMPITVLLRRFSDEIEEGFINRV